MESYELLKDICDILGVDYNNEVLLHIDDICDKVLYLLEQIYKFLGGK